VPLGVRDSRGPGATMGGRRQPAGNNQGPALITPKPTESEQAVATEQTRNNPMRAVFNTKTGKYDYVPLEGNDLVTWQEDRAREATAAVQQPTAPVDPTQQSGAPRASTMQNFQAAAQRAPGTGAAGYQPGVAQPGAQRPTVQAAQPNAQRPTVQVPTGAPAQPGAPAQWQPVAQDTSRYDAQAQRLQELQGTFMSQLERLSGADPFGNQAALQKATDRAVAQAAGTAAGARGGAAALTGAGRQAVGVQAQTAARGAQDIVEQRRRDDIQATSQGLQAISGAAGIGTQLAQNEIALGDQAIKAAEVNLRGYLGNQELGQREKESLRQFALEASKIDMQRYQTDMQYRQSVDANLTQKYIANTQLEGVFAKINAEEGIGAADWLMGAVGLASGAASAVAAGAASDERVKHKRAAPSLGVLREFVSAGKGEFYEYTDTKIPGTREGKNFGPMAQDLQRTAIGRTLVKPGPDGVLRVDTGRLALADHSAISHLASRLQRLERRAAKGGRRGR
jgi:hypothetical protein